MIWVAEAPSSIQYAPSDGPKTNPASPGSGMKGGPGNSVTLLRLLPKVPRKTQDKSTAWSGMNVTAASMPFTRIEPPLKTSRANPVDGARLRVNKRSETERR